MASTTVTIIDLITYNHQLVPVAPPSTKANGQMFVADGTGGTVSNSLYFKNNAGVLTNLSMAVVPPTIPTEVVILPNNAATAVNIELTNLQGSYIIIVKGPTDGATATFFGSSATNATSGSIARITSAPALNTAEVNVVWNAGEKMKLFHSVVPGIVGTTSYTCQVNGLTT